VPRDAVLTAAVAVLAGETPPPSLEDVMTRIAPRPVLLIEAGNGAGGEDLNAAYARAGGASTARWVVPGAGHTAGLTAQPEAYAQRVLTFFERALFDVAE
jgi:hypothetical protein